MPRPDPPEATRFKPGKSGNPAGTPVGSVKLARLLGDRLNSIEPASGKTYGSLAVDALLKAMLQGEEWAWKIAFDRLDGPIRRQLGIEMSGGPGTGVVAISGTTPLQDALEANPEAREQFRRAMLTLSMGPGEAAKFVENEAASVKPHEPPHGNT